MQARRAEGVNPRAFRWARTSMGLPLNTAAKRIGLSSSKSQSNSDKLLAFENGKAVPTQTQLIKIAHVYRRPLIYFYLDEPPPPEDTGVDFRAAPSRTSVQSNAILQCIVRDMHARQGIVKSLIEDDGDTAVLQYVGALTDAVSVTEAVAFIQRLLSVSAADQDSRGLTKADKEFQTLREKVEDLSTFVILAGNLGSHHTDIDESVFRGFVLVDEIAPFIVINEHDAVNAQAFTLIHELVHICLGKSGISGPPLAYEDSAGGNEGVEKFCNDVASEVLLPSEELNPVQRISSLEDAKTIVRERAQSNAVSEPLVAYRLWRESLIDNETYSKLVHTYKERWRQAKDSKREINKKKDSGPSHFTMRRHRLGSGLINSVNRWYQSGELTPTKAGKVLGVKPMSVSKLLTT